MGRPMRFILTAGQASDAPQAIPLLTGIKATRVIADKGGDSDAITGFINQQWAIAVIPPKPSRKTQRMYDRELYKERDLIERAFNRLKGWRRTATRYDRRSICFIAAPRLAATITWST